MTGVEVYMNTYVISIGKLKMKLFQLKYYSTPGHSKYSGHSYFAKIEFYDTNMRAIVVEFEYVLFVRFQLK